MAKLLYSMLMSLDGYTSTTGSIGRGAEEPEVHRFINDLFRPVRTFLYGRRMYETMVFWETADADPEAPDFILDYARDWQAGEKVVYSTTLQEVASERTRIERSFDAEAVRAMKESSPHDLSIDGPTLAAHALRAGLVDEIHLFETTSVVGGGQRFFPDGVELELALTDHRAFGSGLRYARYDVLASGDAARAARNAGE